jgi:hypothetical protein
MKRVVTAALAVAFLVSACASLPVIDSADRASLAAAAVAIAGRVVEGPGDLGPLTEAIERYFLFLAEALPDSAARLARMRDPSELAPCLASSFGTTPYEEALSAFIHWDRERSGPRWSPSKVESLETEHFILETMPGTGAHRDREYLARLVERKFSEIEVLLAPDEAGRARANISRNFESLGKKKVELILPADSRAFKGFGDTANTSWGFAIDEGGLAIVASIRMPYYNALSSAVLVHELTHVVDIFSKLDLDLAPPVPASGGNAREYAAALQAWAEPVFQAIVPYDQGFGEGLAEWVAMRLSPLHRAFFGDPDAMLRLEAARVPLLNDVLAASPTDKDRKLRIVRYTELASLVEFLVRRYGLEAFLEFYMSPPLVEEGFVAVYGQGYGAIQAEWKAARGF